MRLFRILRNKLILKFCLVGKDKLRRFAAIKLFENVFEPVMNQTSDLRGKWRTDVFKNENPIVLELGCGKGEYSVGLGKKYPDKNFIGVDLKGNRIYIGAKEALELNLNNVVFLRTRIDFITNFFVPGEVDEIWLTFSDPQPKKPNKRLSSPPFINRYRQILKKDGVIHMKTDSNLLFEYTQEQIEEQKYNCLESTWDLYGGLTEELDEETRAIFHIKTHYENLFVSKGHVIKYCRFKVS
jgi:tRNA (guanine-N7-)-methyltransferase